MESRKIVKVNEGLCDGCGLCVPNCAEGALRIIDGKAKLVGDAYCDGLGACLGRCPRGAIAIEEREAEPFDEAIARAHVEDERNAERVCPSAQVQTSRAVQIHGAPSASALGQWPVHLRLVSVDAPFLKGADLLITSDCVPFALPDLHGSLMRNRAVLFGCPKFDDARGYADKLGEVLRRNDVESMTVVHMEVPCCYGLDWIVKRALEVSGKKIPVRRYIVTLKGAMKEAQG